MLTQLSNIKASAWPCSPEERSLNRVMRSRQWVHICCWNQIYILEHLQLSQFPYVLGTKISINVTYTAHFPWLQGDRLDDTCNHIFESCKCYPTVILLPLRQGHISSPVSFSSLSLLVSWNSEHIILLVIISMFVYPHSSSPTLHNELLCCIGIEDLIIEKSRHPSRVITGQHGNHAIIVH